MLHPFFSVSLRRLLPAALVRRLDPFEASIQALVERASRTLPPGGRLLDAGAGEARHASWFTHGFYVPVDSGVGEKGWDYSKLAAIGDLRHLPLRGQSMDAVLCVVTLEHVPAPGLVLEEFHRVLRPGGDLWLVTPLLWEEHQKPHDYYRYTSDGLRLLLQSGRFEIRSLQPAGGFFQVLARRCIALPGFFQQGWRWVLFPFLAPVFGLILPLLLGAMDPLDRQRHYTLGHLTHAVRL